jgi:pantoate--beta-alanine ligase
MNLILPNQPGCPMILFKKADDLRKHLALLRKKGEMIGFVPTMGALHAGHISLIKASIARNPSTVCSIFVNPTQFNDPKDYKKYPSTIEKDMKMLKAAKCPMLFLPSIKEVYPKGISVRPVYKLGNLEKIFEGKFRPGHFQGVCMVMERLLRIVEPDRLFLGQKDYQQCMVLRKLIGIMGEKAFIELVINPTLREPDGLAMSSRNIRLNSFERSKAPNIYKALRAMKNQVRKKPILPIKKEVWDFLMDNSLNPDYVEFAHAQDLKVMKTWDGKEKIIALIAVWNGEIRLIDNLLIN